MVNANHIGLKPARTFVQTARVFETHARDTLDDREGEAGGAADQLVRCGVILEHRFGERTDENFEQLGVDFLMVGVALGGILEVYCSVVPLLPLEASSISASATRTSARHFKSSASSSACFSSGP
jgi:hypothetical protein